MKLLRRVHRFLLPECPEMGYSAYLVLLFLGFFLLSIFLNPPKGGDAIIVALGLILFLICYFRVYWVRDWRLLFYIASICGIGSLMAIYSTSASVFFIYAAAFSAQVPGPRKAYLTLVSVILYMGLFSWFTQQHPFFWAPGLFLGTIIGALNIHQEDIFRKNKAIKQSQDEIRQLARAAERERISRDLHDLLGHSLSVITLKSELAAKIIENGHSVTNALREIRAVEALSRDTMVQIRNALSGYNKATLEGELLSAKVATTAAGIQLHSEFKIDRLEPHFESQLALILREAITNVIRHADTRQVWVNLHNDKGDIMLSVKDEGKMSELTINSGLANMKARIEKLNGEMHVEYEPSTCLTFRCKRKHSND